MTRHNYTGAIRGYSRAAFSLIIFVQVIDVGIHVAANQVEPVRILAGVILTLYSGLGLTGRASVGSALTASAAYLVLNAWFLSAHGLTNPDIGNAPRYALFALVTISIGLTLFSVHRRVEAAKAAVEDPSHMSD
ncbi:MAG: hypothetical protein AAFZ91_12740 [Pseudomonadota bacterium]